MLGVKLRSSQVRASRNRLAAVGLCVAFTAVLGACVVGWGGQWLLNRFIYQNRAFAIQEFDLRTDGVIAVDQLRHWTGIQPGANLLALDLARVKRDLEMIPWVDSASVERILPHTLRIRVFEREPVAQINVLRPGADGGIEVAPCYISATGYLMLPLDPRQRSVGAPPPEPLPILGGGLNADDIQPGRRIKSPQIAAALQLLDSFQRSPMASLVDLSRIDLSMPDVLTVTTDQGAEVTLGLSDLDQQLRRWHEIAQRAQRESKVIAFVDLAVTNNIPVRWLEAGAATPSPPRLPQPLRLRRKHV
ncbi:MAG: cell division protein FtsQ/DivIB [Limisphaerales bacterium]